MPQGRSINLTLQTNIKSEETHCTHPETFCPNGLLVTEGHKNHTCSTCGEKLETDVPPCNCCCHEKTCGGRSSCLEPTCNESEQMGLIPAEVRQSGERKAREVQQQPVSPAISLESLSGILTIVINQAKTDFESGRLLYATHKEAKRTYGQGQMPVKTDATQLKQNSSETSSFHCQRRF